MQYYNNVVHVLEWGAKEWHDVPTSDKGYSFLKTYVRAIKRIRLTGYLAVSQICVCICRRVHVHSSPVIIIIICCDVYLGSEGIRGRVRIQRRGAHRDGESDGGRDNTESTSGGRRHGQGCMVLVPRLPCRGCARVSTIQLRPWVLGELTRTSTCRSTLGALFMMQGISAKKDGDAEEADKMLAAATKFYKQAAEMYPPDDEYFPCTSSPPSCPIPMAMAIAPHNPNVNASSSDAALRTPTPP